MYIAIRVTIIFHDYVSTLVELQTHVIFMSILKMVTYFLTSFINLIFNLIYRQKIRLPDIVSFQRSTNPMTENVKAMMGSRNMLNDVLFI